MGYFWSVLYTVTIPTQTEKSTQLPRKEDLKQLDILDVWLSGVRQNSLNIVAVLSPIATKAAERITLPMVAQDSIWLKTQSSHFNRWC
jgi:hypothetical protein